MHPIKSTLANIQKRKRDKGMSCVRLAVTDGTTTVTTILVRVLDLAARMQRFPCRSQEHGRQAHPHHLSRAGFGVASSTPVA